ncbi:hypothetical protein, partial [Undibacterium luofuense]
MQGCAALIEKSTLPNRESRKIRFIHVRLIAHSNAKPDGFAPQTYREKKKYDVIHVIWPTLDVDLFGRRD